MPFEEVSRSILTYLYLSTYIFLVVGIPTLDKEQREHVMLLIIIIF